MVAAAELDGAQQMLAGLVGVEDDNAQRGTRRRLRRYWLGYSGREAERPLGIALRSHVTWCCGLN